MSTLIKKPDTSTDIDDMIYGEEEPRASER